MTNLKHIGIFLFSIGFFNTLVGQELINISQAERNISPSYRIVEKPRVVDTIVPTPTINYPLLIKSMPVQTNVQSIEASKIKIIDNLNKLYPGYVKAGLGNYTMPLGELYYNAQRNRQFNYGVHINHLSSFGKIKGYAPTQFDETTGKLFGKYFGNSHIYSANFDYLNHGYRFYGIENDSIPKDSLRNRVSAYQSAFQFSNFERKDNEKLMYLFKVNHRFFHQFKDSLQIPTSNVRENNVGIGATFSYKHQQNTFAVETDVLLNYYKFGEQDTNVNELYRRNLRNNIFHFRPTISSYRFDNKLKAEVGFDLNFDLNSTTIFKPFVIANIKYSLLNGMIIPYAGLDGKMEQNSYYSLNRLNPFIANTIDLRNTKKFMAYGGIKGTISKQITFNFMAHASQWTDAVLFKNDTLFSDLYMFNPIYDNIKVLGFQGSLTFQADEKLKIDLIGEYNNYITENELYAWFLPELKFTLRGNYNLYEKFYIKVDLGLQGGRKSPFGVFYPDDTKPEKELYDLGFLADANIHLEYRYNSRISAFAQFNNLAGQRYYRWMNYPVFGFQALGGVTFAF